MARALVGYVGSNSNEQVLAAEVARLRRRVSDLESELADVRERQHAEIDLDLHRFRRSSKPDLRLPAGTARSLDPSIDAVVSSDQRRVARLGLALTSRRRRVPLSDGRPRRVGSPRTSLTSGDSCTSSR